MDDQIEVGQVLLGKYRVESILGQGGMGIVVAAVHIELGRRVAIKKLLPQAMQYPDSCERFLREAKAAARLAGEHIAQVHDTGVLDDGTPYILMEYLDGLDLKKVVRDRGPIPPREAAHYVYQACEAVAEAHRLGVAHRDLKPANMMLVRRPNGAGCIKVLDFGISKELDPAARIYDLTRSGVIMCSPAYMAPEQVSFPKEVDPRSDIWALGVVLYELVTGILPFHADSGMELLAKILQLRPQSPVEIVPGLSGELEGIILKCLDKDRDKRFQTVPELMEALWPFVSGEQILETSKRLPIDDIEVTFPDFFNASETNTTETRTRELPPKGVGGTVKMPDDAIPDAPTRVLPRKIPLAKTIKMNEVSERETQTIVVSDKRDSAPAAIEEDDVDFKIPTRRKGTGIIVGLVLSAAIVLGGGAVRVRRGHTVGNKSEEAQTIAKETAPPATTNSISNPDLAKPPPTESSFAEAPTNVPLPKETPNVTAPDKPAPIATNTHPSVGNPAASTSASPMATVAASSDTSRTSTAPQPSAKAGSQSLGREGDTDGVIKTPPPEKPPEAAPVTTATNAPTATTTKPTTGIVQDDYE